MKRAIKMKEKFKYFTDEDTPTLEEVLDNRERRIGKIRELEDRFPDKTIFCFKLNIPGAQKINDAVVKIFAYGVSEISKILSGASVLFKEEKIIKTGPELFLVTDYDTFLLKEKMVELEESSAFGRLYDVDLVKNGENITREMLNYEPRKCFICENDAKVCARNRAHSVDEMLLRIENLIEDNKEDLWQIEK